jgi:hypothetical protein
VVASQIKADNNKEMKAKLSLDEGVWLRLLKFNRYCSIFVLFDNYCLIIN